MSRSSLSRLLLSQSLGVGRVRQMQLRQGSAVSSFGMSAQMLMQSVIDYPHGLRAHVHVALRLELIQQPWNVTKSGFATYARFDNSQ